MRQLLVLLLFTSLVLGQNPNTPIFPTAVATDQNLSSAPRLAASTLASGIDASTLTIPVTSGATFQDYIIVRIDNEEILVCDVTGNTLTACSGGRGFDGTSAVSHSSAASVRAVITRWHHNQLAAEIKSIETQLGVAMSNVLSNSGTLTVVGTVPRLSANYTLGPSDLSCDTAGDCTLYDATGPTTWQVRAGSSQSSTDVAQFLDSSGAVMSTIRFSGSFSVGAAGARTAAVMSSGLGLASGADIKARSTTNLDTGSYDVGLRRTSARRFQVYDGVTAGQFGDLDVRGIYQTGDVDDIISIVMAPGAAQLTNQLARFYNSSGQLISEIDVAGGWTTLGSEVRKISHFQNSLLLSSDAQISFANGVNIIGSTVDARIIRPSAGRIGFTNATGSANIPITALGATFTGLADGCLNATTGVVGSTGTACGAGGGGLANYEQLFTSQVAVTLTHNLGTDNIIVACYDGSGFEIDFVGQIVDTNNYDVDFEESQSGKCIVNGTGASSTVEAENGINGDGSIATPLSLAADSYATFECSGSLDFDTLNPTGTHCQRKSFACSGALQGDAIEPQPPGTLEAGIHLEWLITATDVVTVEACKITSGDATMPNQTFGVALSRAR